MTSSPAERRRAWAVSAAAAALFAAAAWRFAPQPVSPDELHSLVIGESLHSLGRPLARDGSEGGFYSPLLSFELMSLSFDLFGVGDRAAKVPGWLCVAALVLAVPWVMGRLDSRRRGWALAGLTASPALLRGATILEIDNTALVLLIPLWLAAVASLEKETEAWLPALLFAAALGCRVTTPLFLVPWVVLYAARRRRLGPALLSLAAGGALFAVVWTQYCALKGFPADEPFLYTFRSFLRSKTGAIGAAGAAGLVLWTGPWLAAALALAVRADWRRPAPRELFLGSALFLLAGFTATAGLSFGYPRYQAPALALLVFAAAAYVDWDEKAPWRAAAGVAALAAAQWAILGDPLYLYRFQWRLLLSMNQAAPWAAWAVRGAASLAASAAALAWWRRESRSWLRPLLLWSVAFGAGLAAAQLAAPYDTGLNYGQAGFSDAVDRLRGCPGRVLATEDFLHALGRPLTEFVPDEVFDKKAELAARLEEPGTACLIEGVPTQTVAQVRDLGSEEIQAALRGWSREEAGSFVIYKRSAKPGE